VEWLETLDTGMDTSCINRTTPLEFRMPDE
jgi:hypothetical protein